MNILRREPVIIRNLVVASLAVVATLVPGIDVGTIEGIIMGAIALIAGTSARAKVTPVG